MAEVATLEKQKRPKAAPDKAPIEFKQADKVLLEQRNNAWLLNVPAGMQPEDLVRPRSLGAAAADLRPYDTIHAIEKGESWFAEYLVHDVGVGWATLVLLRAIQLPPRTHETADRVPDGHQVFFAGMESKWAVHRTTDDVRMKDGFDSREQALRWLLEHASLRQH